MKRILIICFFAFLALNSLSQNIEGEWKFDYILKDNVENGDNLKPISDNDKMQINGDGTFQYTIKNANLIANGKLCNQINNVLNKTTKLIVEYKLI